jgi:hypothetical protein
MEKLKCTLHGCTPASAIKDTSPRRKNEDPFKDIRGLGVVAHVYNPSYTGTGGRSISLRLVQAEALEPI